MIGSSLLLWLKRQLLVKFAIGTPPVAVDCRAGALDPAAAPIPTTPISDAIKKVFIRPPLPVGGVLG
jgi:hypothetical protein